MSQDDALERTSDTELVARLELRDQSALLELYRRYSRRLYAIVRRIVTDERLAEEILQDVFMRLWAKASLDRSAEGEVPAWSFHVSKARLQTEAYARISNALFALRGQDQVNPRRAPFTR